MNFKTDVSKIYLLKEILTNENKKRFFTDKHK